MKQASTADPRYGPEETADSAQPRVGRRRQVERVVSRIAAASAYRRWQGLVNLRRGLRRSRIIVYHSFSRGGWGGVEPDDFRHQLDVLSSAFDVVGLPRLVDDLSSGAPTDRSVALTIDDAYEDFYTQAYPILRELRMPATVFVPTGYIGKHNDWEEASETRLRVMSAGQLRELDPALITVGSHSVRHKALAQLDGTATVSEVRQSKENLEQILGRAVTLFAYPFGHLSTYTARTQEALRSAGYRAAVSTRWGTYGSPSDLFELRRIDLHGAHRRAEMLSRLDGDWDWIAGRELVGHAFRRSAG